MYTITCTYSKILKRFKLIGEGRIFNQIKNEKSEEIQSIYKSSNKHETKRSKIIDIKQRIQ